MDDYSTDKSLDQLIEKTKNAPNIQVLANKSNQGPFQTRLLAVKNCRTPLWTYLDIDDNLDLEILAKYYPPTPLNFAPIYKFEYTDKNFGSKGNFKTSINFQSTKNLLNYPTWNFPACGIYEVDFYLDEFGHLENMPHNFDEYAFRHYHTVLNKPIKEIEVCYQYVIEGTSLSRTFSEKRLSYYLSIKYLKDDLCKNRYTIKRRSIITSSLQLLRTDLKQIFQCDESLLKKIIWTFRVFNQTLISWLK